MDMEEAEKLQYEVRQATESYRGDLTDADVALLLQEVADGILDGVYMCST